MENLNIEKFKESNSAPFENIYKDLSEAQNEIFVFEKNDTQFITNNISLSAMIRKEFNIDSKKVNFGDIIYNDNLKNSMFIKDETLGNFWMSGMVEDSLALILTSSTEKLKKFVPVIVKKHMEEFESIYNGQIFNFHEKMPELYISVAVDKFNNHKTFASKQEMENCQTSINEMIDRAKLQRDTKCKTL